MAFYHNPQIVTDSLILYVDAGNTKSYPGSGTTWYDLTKNGRDFTLVNTPTYETINGGSFEMLAANTEYAEISRDWFNSWIAESRNCVSLSKACKMFSIEVL